MVDNIKRYGIVAAIVGTITAAGFLTPAAAQTENAVGSAFDDLQADLTGIYIPAMIALVLLGVGVALGLRWLRKGASKA